MITSSTLDDISPAAYLSAVQFRSILDTLDEIGLHCTFFIVPGEDSSHFFEPDYESCLKNSLSLGHELSLHGYNHSKNEFGYLSVGSWSIPLSICEFIFRS